jgi:hypothetical protein
MQNRAVSGLAVPQFEHVITRGVYGPPCAIGPIGCDLADSALALSAATSYRPRTDCLVAQRLDDAVVPVELEG